MSGVNANFQFGLSATVGTAAQSKSYAYDESQYIQSDPVSFALTGVFPIGTFTAKAIVGTAVAQFVSPFAKQLRSITAIPVVPNGGTATVVQVMDYFQICLLSMYPQAFGTATGPSYLAAGVSTGTFYGSSTTTGTSFNMVQIFNVMTFMTGQGGMVNGTAIVSGTVGACPQTVQLAGGTFTIVVANGLGTATQGGYVFPIGPNGGLSLNPGDVLVVQKGTDTSVTYIGELEFTFTPGGLVTR